MRWVSLPEELAAPHLLDLSQGPGTFHASLQSVLAEIAEGELDMALDLTGRALATLNGTRDRHLSALVLVLRADILRRQMRWEDALDAIRRALHWLELDVSPVARYNEAIAVYLEGIVHYTLRADEKAQATLSYAQDVLVASERHWAFEHNNARSSDCRNLIRWLTKLLALQMSEAMAPVVMVMPVYEFANRTLIRTDAVALPPFQLMIPSEVVARYCPPELRPLQLEALEFPSLRPDITYAAVRIAEPIPVSGDAWFSDVREGELLILEVTSAGQGARDRIPVSDQPFVRTGDGHVIFRSPEEDLELGVFGAGMGLVGIPRALLTDREGT